MIHTHPTVPGLTVLVLSLPGLPKPVVRASLSDQARARELLKVGGEYFSHHPRHAREPNPCRHQGAASASVGKSGFGVEDDDTVSVAGESIASGVTFGDGVGGGNNDGGKGGGGGGGGVGVGRGGGGEYVGPSGSPVGEVDRSRSWMTSDWFGADIVFFDCSPIALGGKSTISLSSLRTSHLLDTQHLRSC